jgi:hypothetical protein
MIFKNLVLTSGPVNAYSIMLIVLHTPFKKPKGENLQKQLELYGLW